MPTAHKRAKKLVAVAAGLLVAGSVAVAIPASAATLPGTTAVNVRNLPQGGTDTVHWVMRYDSTPAGGSTTIKPGGTMTFNAPPGTTFPAQSTVPALVGSDGQPWGATSLTLTGCTVSSGGTVLTCTTGSTNAGGASPSWNDGQWREFSPTVTASPTAPLGATSAAGTLSFTANDGTQYTATDNLDVNITAPTVVDTPIVSLVGGITGGLVLAAAGGVLIARRRRKLAAQS